ncbi:MAG: MarR family protein [Methanomassiliicoccales archaeon PtaU1.Bin124]|nr:MAG: MarR family protein [Methanomassiliicoccales archaeon PtaU1.Bin124]
MQVEGIITERRGCDTRRGSMIDLQHLLAQIGSETRLHLLGILRHRDLGIQEISDELFVSSTDVTSGLNLLIEAGMVERTPSGGYRDSAFGALVWENLAPFRYVASHSEYLRAHDLSTIPVHLLRSIDRLSDASIISVRTEAVEDVKRQWTNIAGEFSIITESLTPELVSMMVHLASLGVKVRCLMQNGVAVDLLAPHLGAKNAPIEVRWTDHGRMLLHVSHNFCLLALKKKRGGADPDHILLGTDLSSISWCRDLFAYHWQESRLK